MLISKKVNVYRILSGTWRHFLFEIIACVAAYFFYKYIESIHLFDSILVSSIIPTILGTALAFFIGFNNNQAYDRWWEARKIWGSLVNDSRSWARQIIYYVKEAPAADTVDLHTLKHTMVYRHIAFLYALKDNLRNSNFQDYRAYLSKEDIIAVEKESNKSNAILNLQSEDLEKLRSQDAIDGFKFLEFNKMLINFCDEMGMSERIKNTVFPTTYNFYTRVFIWIFIISVTWSSVDEMGAWSIMIGILVGYIFLTTHKIGMALLNPFENIPTGIPLDQITRTIEINLLEALKETNIPAPVKSINGEYIM
ncbi:bestrophin family ion channel [Galbibacter sp. PAP.153]|uniref:bestrophin family protein n=1 Tax=Galbibacter sp. PAP.153 TaxID=3104623 RepID=UPI0030089FAF